MGEVWCSMLWQARANLIKKLGYADGSLKILQIVTEGMKKAPADPTFIEARNAIYQAELALTNGNNRAELENAFAKRGLGADATSPSSTTTAGVVESFRETTAPAVTVTTPAQNSVLGAFSVVQGTATDGSGSGVAGNVVNFTLYHASTDAYWTGSAWNNTGIVPQLGAPLNATTHVWTWNGALPSATTGTLRFGQYRLRAFTLDTSGNNSVSVTGVNDITFVVDGTPPAVTIAAPAANAVISQDGYGFNGTATDDNLIDRVQPAIRRESDNAYWTGSNWTSGIVLLTASYDANTHAWSCTTPLPPLGSGLTAGAYTFFAVAYDKAGNSSSVASPITVDFAYRWIGGTQGNPNDWGTAANWTPNGVPGRQRRHPARQRRPGLIPR